MLNGRLSCRSSERSGKRNLQSCNAGWWKGVQQAATTGLTSRRSCRPYGIWVREVIVVVHVVTGEDGAFCRYDAGSAYSDFGSDGPIDVRINYTKRQQLAIAVLRDRCRATQASESLHRIQRTDVAVASHRNRRACKRIRNGRRGEFCANGLRSAVRQIHLEDMVGRRNNELILLSQHQRVDAVDRLRDVGDGDLLGVALEDVERDAGKQRIAHGRLLGEVVLRRELGTLAVPCP